MRASRHAIRQKTKVRVQNKKSADIHISGAEGIYKKTDIHRIVKKYIERALSHPKGRAEKIIITIEEIKQKPKEIPSLPLTTLSCSTPSEGKSIIRQLLKYTGVSKSAIDTAFNLIKKDNMRGAAVITAEKGDRLEPDRERGIRVSRLGISKPLIKTLSARLSRYNINTDTVKEALILASKVASCKEIIAELCVSDDPYYTTGYIASRNFGYLRIPDIKHRASKSGGRAFFVNEKANINEIINYLERTPVIVKEVSPCRGVTTVDEILNRHYK